MKSLLSLGSDAPHVHLRLRKRLSRCTLDCGFKTSESPALRGFVAGPGRKRHRAFILCFYRTAFPIQKFSLKSSIFRPNPFLQIWPKSYRYNAVSNRFSTSLTNASRLLSRVKAGTHSALLKGSHTTAHTPKQGAFRMGRYHYPRHVLHVHEHPRAGYQNGVLCRFWGLVVGAPKERREPSGQRCAYARRCPEASRPRWAA